MNSCFQFARFILSVFLIATFHLTAAAAKADTIVYDSFGPALTVTGAYVASPAPIYMGTIFSPTSTVNLTTLTGNWAATVGTDPSAPITVSLWTSSAGAPGTQLESWALTVNRSLANYSLASSPNVALAAGNNYWVLMNLATTYVADSAFWGTYAPSPITGGFWSGTAPNNLSQHFSNLSAAALQIQGVSAVPEPSSLALMGIGLLAVSGVLRRTLARKTAA